MLKVKNRMVVWVQNGCMGTVTTVSVSVVFLYSHLADWELQLAANAQHHKRVSYHISLAWENI